MKKVNFYIGSNNQTHQVETDKALGILAAHYEGMSVSELIGYWKGSQEKTLLVSIVCESVDYTEVKQVCKELELHENTLYRWIREIEDHGQRAFPGKGSRDWISQNKLKQLEKENQKLKEELELLKKFWIFLEKKHK